MTITNPALIARRILDTDAKLHETFESLLELAFRRQVWIFVLDENHRVAGPLLPLEDYPLIPTAPVEGGSFGRSTFIHSFVRILSDMLDFVEGSSIALVWEDPDATEDEIHTWAKATIAHCPAQRVTLRAQFSLTNEGFRQLTPDDLS